MCNLLDMSYHHYSKSCCEVIWSLRLHEHLQILKMCYFHLGHVPLPGPVKQVAETTVGPTSKKGGFLKLVWNIVHFQTINMVAVHEQVF